jgi:hypothetical protein
MTHVARLASFDFSGFGPERSRGLVARDLSGRILLTDAHDSAGTSLTNAIEGAVFPARQIVGAQRDAPVFLWTPDDPVRPDAVWRVTFGADGAGFEEVEVDPDLGELKAALMQARG